MLRKSVLAASVFAAAGLAATTASAEIIIATAGPMTGQYASFGEQMKAGAEQAVADINGDGGINGEKVVLEIGDDVCDPDEDDVGCPEDCASGSVCGDDICDSDEDSFERSVDTHIKTLRAKLKPLQADALIATRRGIGYYLENP